MSVFKSIKENGLKYVTPKRAWMWFRSKIRQLIGLSIKQNNAVDFAEVITYKSLTCPDCVQRGACRVCECPINELFTAMDAPCSDQKFPSFKEYGDGDWVKGWKKFKKDNKIYFTIFYG